MLSKFDFAGLDRGKLAAAKYLDAVIAGREGEAALTGAQAQELLALLAGQLPV